MLAKQALEIGALALAAWATEREESPGSQTPHLPVVPQEPEPAPIVDEASMPADDFLKVIADAATRYYRAFDHEGEMAVAFYGDGRMRIADGAHRFAGMVQNGHAHMLQIGTDDWTEVFVRTTPDGVLQLELRDGPHDGRVLTCESDNLRMIAER